MRSTVLTLAAGIPAVLFFIIYSVPAGTPAINIAGGAAALFALGLLAVAPFLGGKGKERYTRFLRRLPTETLIRRLRTIEERGERSMRVRRLEYGVGKAILCERDAA